jgi:hypothetical protein
LCKSNKKLKQEGEVRKKKKKKKKKRKKKRKKKKMNHKFRIDPLPKRRWHVFKGTCCFHLSLCDAVLQDTGGKPHSY